MLGLAAVPAVLQFLMMIYMPESQRWLARKQKDDKVLDVLKRIYQPEEAKFQLQLLQKEIDDQKEFNNMTECQRYGELFTTYKKCVFISCMLQCLQQFLGINTIMYYGPQVIINTGLTIDGISDKE